jgi:dTDP-glucose 4,6-dehydratase
MSNVVGTYHVLEYALGVANLEKFVYFSTDEVFGTAPPGVFYNEWDNYNSRNPYAATKAGGEELVLSYATTYKLPVLIIHCMNLYGERQHPEKFIPKIVNCVLDGSTIPIHADKTKTQAGLRHYLHCRNMSDALLHLLQVGHIDTLGAHLSNRAKVNIVGEREVNNYELALWVSKIVGKPLHFEMVDYHTSRPGHDLRYALDGSFLKSLGWIPPVDFETSLERTVRWMLDNPRWLSGMKGQ